VSRSHRNVAQAILSLNALPSPSGWRLYSSGVTTAVPPPARPCGCGCSLGPLTATGTGGSSRGSDINQQSSCTAGSGVFLAVENKAG
jgi:hypothetical protein